MHGVVILQACSGYCCGCACDEGLRLVGMGLHGGHPELMELIKAENGGLPKA